MKKTILILTALLLQGVVSAQTLDTVTGPGGRVEGYHYTWWYDSCMGYFDTFPTRYSNGDMVYFFGMVGDCGTMVLTQHRFRHPTWMKGVAVLAMRLDENPQNQGTPTYRIRDTTLLPEYVRVWLYDSNTSDESMWKIAELRWDTAQPKWYKLPVHSDTNRYGFFYTKVYEAMFDSPILIDSNVFFNGTSHNIEAGTNDAYMYYNRPPMLYYGLTDLFLFSREYLAPSEYRFIFGDDYIYEPCYGADSGFLIDSIGKILRIVPRSNFGFFLPIVDYANVSVNSSDPAMGSAGPTDQISKQTTVNIYARPEYGIRFTHWNDGVTDNPRPVFITQDTAFTAYFEPNTRHQVYTASRNSGTGIVTGGGEYWYGDTVTLHAKPLVPYTFRFWNDGVTDNPRTFVVTQDTMFTAYFGSQLSITEPDASQQLFTLTPNPAHNSVTVTINSQLSILNSQLSLTLTDAAGRELLTLKVQQPKTTIPLGQYPAGTYFVTLRTPDATSTQRLVIE